MPTRFPERRPQPGLTGWHIAGISIGFAGVMLAMILMVSERSEVAPKGKSAPGITTGIAPSDAKR